MPLSTLPPPELPEEARRREAVLAEVRAAELRRLDELVLATTGQQTLDLR